MKDLKEDGQSSKKAETRVEEATRVERKKIEKAAEEIIDRHKLTSLSDLHEPLLELINEFPLNRPSYLEKILKERAAAAEPLRESK